jgi:proteasome accessory factor B
MRIYQGIVDSVKEGNEVETEQLCSLLGINEKTLFTYLESAAAAIDVGMVKHNGQALNIEAIKEYNRKNKMSVSKVMNKSTRLAKLINVLNQRTPFGGATLGELAEKLDVTERTVYRDLCDLEQELNIRIVRPDRNMGEKGRYKLDNTYLPAISPEKAMFIYLSLLQQKETALTLGTQEIKEALIGTLTRNRYSLQAIALKELESRVYIVDEALIDTERVSKTFLEILHALNQSYVIYIEYFLSYNQEISKRLVEPYGLVCKHHNWYLIGKCLEKNDLRTFRIDQIEYISPRQHQKFLYPADFQLGEYVKDRWGVFEEKEATHIKVQFAPSVAYRVKKIKYHPSQMIEEEREDGSIVVSFKIKGIIEFISWLLQWKTGAKLLEPPALQEKMRKIASQIEAMYADNSVL